MAYDIQYISKPLALEGAYNVRDLGSYLTETGTYTRSNMLLQADGLHSLQRASFEAHGQDYLFESNPADMEKTLAFFEETYGTAEQYMQTIGLSKNEIEIIKMKLI